MKTNNLKKIVKNRKRPGRGISAGRGKTAGRGTKGQKSRSGYNIPKGFEGGQNPIKKRIPKLGGFNYQITKNQIVNFSDISKYYQDDEMVSPKTLLEKGLIKNDKISVKILANGQLTKMVKFSGVKFSDSAKKAAQKK
jgi:large subunit ribosomal protein L15